MYSMKNNDGREYNLAKGVNVATDFNEFKDALFNKKVFRQKMKTIQSQNWDIRSQQNTVIMFR